MKKHNRFLLIIFILSFFYGCKDQQDCCIGLENGTATLNFTHNWDGKKITDQDFNQFIFTNKNKDEISIERLRYVISNFSLTNSKNHYLIDLADNASRTFSITDLNTGTYALKFTFGFTDLNNLDGVYQDLNSVNFNVPEMLGGGYHYMQFDGKYKTLNNQEAGFNYHAIRAVDTTDPNKLIFKDTSFEVDLGTIEITKNTNIEIQMNVAEWFKNPNTWNLNELNTVLMPNYNAQILMHENGKSVFSLGGVTQ